MHKITAFIRNRFGSTYCFVLYLALVGLVAAMYFIPMSQSTWMNCLYAWMLVAIGFMLQRTRCACDRELQLERHTQRLEATVAQLAKTVAHLQETQERRDN